MLDFVEDWKFDVILFNIKWLQNDNYIMKVKMYKTSIIELAGWWHEYQTLDYSGIWIVKAVWLTYSQISNVIWLPDNLPFKYVTQWYGLWHILICAFSVKFLSNVLKTRPLRVPIWDTIQKPAPVDERLGYPTQLNTGHVQQQHAYFTNQIS